MQTKVTHSWFETTRPTRAPVGSQFTLRLLRLQDGPEVCQQKPVAAEDLASAQELEPALCSPLRSLKVHESVIELTSVNEITERAIFTNLVQDEEKVPKCATAFGIDRSETADFPHQREMAELIVAWRQAKAQYEVNTTADAAAKVHGEPVTVLSMDHLESAISCGMAARRPLASFSISSFMRRPPGNFSKHFVRFSPLELVLGSPSRFSAGLRRAADRSAMDAISSNNGDRKVDSEKSKKQFGPDLCEEDLLAQTNYEDFEEQLAEGCFAVSQEEADTQRRQTTGPASVRDASGRKAHASNQASRHDHRTSRSGAAPRQVHGT